VADREHSQPLLTMDHLPSWVSAAQASTSNLPRRWWINLLLFAATLVSTTVYGDVVAACFFANRPFNSDLIWAGYSLLIHHDPLLLQGLLFSAPLLLILTAHELGHYVACKRWRVEATLPFFLPSPMLLGTFGAFIRIKSPIYTRRSLFDIGVSGPLAGFAVLMPFLIVGIALSHATPHIASAGDFVFGTPLLIRLVEWIRFPGSPVGDIALHPIAQAAWAGLLATAINLLPIGQLDGGHIMYALFGPIHKKLSRLFLIFLLPMAYFSWSWLFWAVLLFFLGLRHPLIYDETPLDVSRKRIALAALAILVLSISLTPVRLR
jgi:membrane-associated protease RseP (regulator of RpoE activity)